MLIRTPIAIAITSGPDWATIMTAFGTVGAVIAAVWIAIASARKTNKLVAAERVHSDDQLRKQQQHSDEQLETERAAADARLQKQFSNAEELDQRGDAAAVEVSAFRLTPSTGFKDDPENPSGRPAVIVVNKGKSAITNVTVVLSPDGRSTVPLSRFKNLVDLGVFPTHFTEDVIGVLGEVYGGTIAPGAAMRFEGDDILVDTLRTSFAIVRWIDRWADCWEYRQGQVYKSTMEAPWLQGSGSGA